MGSIFVLLSLIVFFSLLLIINKKNLGVASFNEYATSNGAFGFFTLTFAIIAAFYLGSSYTVFGSAGVTSGVIAIYVTPYVTFCFVLMMLFSQRTLVWGQKYDIVTLSNFLGYRYESPMFQVYTCIIGIIGGVPWLMLELVAGGYVFYYATGGLISPALGIIIAVIFVLIYVTSGGMKSVLTANLLQGLIMVFGGCALFYWLIVHYWGGITEGYQILWQDHREMLTYPGPGAPASPIAGWTSMIFPSAVGGFMFLWVFNKSFAASSIRELKKTGFLTPILGAILWLFLTMLANFGRLDEYVFEHPGEVYLYLAQKAGVFPLALMSIIIMAATIGTVGSIIQSCSASFSEDIVGVFKKDISDKNKILAARIFVFVFTLTATLGSAKK
jgi:SSS family solute:Na+ symporter